MTAPHAPPLSSRLAGVLLGLLGLVLCVVFAGYLAIRHVVWPQLDRWRPELVAQLAQRLDRPVSIDAIRPTWTGLHPALELEGLRIAGADGEPRLEVGSAYARISWRSLAWRVPRLAVLRLDAPTVVVEHLASGRLAVAGFELPADGGSGSHALDWLLTQGTVSVTEATVRFVDRGGAIAPLEVRGLSAALRGAGRRAQASVSIGRAGDAAESAKLVAEFFRAPLARPSDWRRWRGEVHLDGRGVDADRALALARAFGADVPQAADGLRGRLDALAWLRFDDGAVLDGTLKGRAVHASVPLADGTLAFDALAAEARVERQRDGGHVLRIAGLSATDPRGFEVAADGEAELGFDGSRTLRDAWLRLVAFDAAAALQAARRLPLPSAARERLAPVALSGQVRDLTLRWRRPDTPAAETRPADRSVELRDALPAAPRLELSASFERLGLSLGEAADGRRLPSFANLSGTVRASERDGTLTLAGTRASLSFPGLFDEPTFAVDRLDADLAWTRDPGTRSVEVTASRIAFANADARGTAAGSWRGVPGAGPGTIELEGRIGRVDLARIARYLPTRLPTATRAWVERSVLSGTAEDLRVEVRGDLHDFPFRDRAAGRFRIAAAVRDGVLDYHPQWPRIEQVRGDAVFEGGGFEIRGQSAGVEGVRLADVVARLADYREPLLAVEGRAAGPAQRMLAFVDASPLAAQLSAFTRDPKVDGDARLALKLALPLRDVAATRVAATLELGGNDVAIDSTLPPFGAVAGRVEFTERGLANADLRATLLGGPIHVEGRQAGEGRMRIEASGSIDAAGMRTLVDNPLTRRLAGRTDYRASVDVERRASTLRIESDLVGLASTLPAPFAKQAADPWPLRVVSQPLVPTRAGARPPGDRLDLKLGEHVALAVERERDAAGQRLVIRRAGFALDGEPALLDSGLSVLVRARSIDLDAWRAVLGDSELEQIERSARQGGAVGMSLVPDLVSVVADDLRVAGRDLHEVVVGASRAGGRWRANVASREIEGHFDWRDARPGEQAGTLTARFARLALPSSRESEVESALSASPSRLPALDVIAEELVLGSLPLGRLELSATNGGGPTQPVWRLDRLVLSNPDARLEARGSWAFQPGQRPRPGAPTASIGDPPAGAVPVDADRRSTSLDFELEVRDAGRMLDGMGLRGTVHGGSGSMGGRVHWHGSPLAIDFASLDGLLRLAIGKGEFLKVDPGAAKLISVLNLQSLPKRLAGDFRDLFGEGFAFDAITGEIRVDQGIARTGDLRMRGLQAQVTIRGEADLQNETQRLNVEVVPELNAGLASLAVGAMINPVIGLGTFAAQYALRKPLQDVLAYDVDVTGSWSDPTVSERTRRPAYRRLEATP